MGSRQPQLYCRQFLTQSLTPSQKVLSFLDFLSDHFEIFSRQSYHLVLTVEFDSLHIRTRQMQQVQMMTFRGKETLSVKIRLPEPSLSKSFFTGL